MRDLKCEKCDKKMEFLGNISGIFYTSNPEQWDDVYVCRNCKAKKTIRERGTPQPDYSFVEGFEEQ